MTAAERKKLDRFLKHVSRKLANIEANFRMMRSLHAFEVSQLNAKLRQRKARAK